MKRRKYESHLYTIELNDDLVSFKNEPLVISKPDQKWELYSGPEWLWNEGPFMLKHNGKYYLRYSAKFYKSRSYSVGYAVAENTMDPFAKAAQNPVLFPPTSKFWDPGTIL